MPGPNGLTGRTLRISTPAESEAPPVEDSRGRGQGGREIHEQVETLYDNPRVDPEAIIAKECARTGLSRAALLESSAWLREYMGIWVIETARAACPAWTDAVDEKCRREWPRPSHFHAYTGHDWGGVTGDPHAALLGYLDFKASKLVVEYEHEKRGIDTQQLAAEWKALETEAWGARGVGSTLAKLRLLRALHQATSGIPEAGARAENARSAVPSGLRQQLPAASEGYGLAPRLRADADREGRQAFAGGHPKLRRMRQEKIIIHPRCVRLLEQVRTGLWNKTRTEWLRTVKDHLDLLDCLVYIARNVFLEQ